MSGFSPDTIFLFSIVFLLLGVPFVITALIDRSVPKISLILTIIGGVGLAYILTRFPGEYGWRDVPRISLRNCFD